MEPGKTGCKLYVQCISPSWSPNRSLLQRTSSRTPMALLSLAFIRYSPFNIVAAPFSLELHRRPKPPQVRLLAAPVKAASTHRRAPRTCVAEFARRPPAVYSPPARRSDRILCSSPLSEMRLGLLGHCRVLLATRSRSPDPYPWPPDRFRECGVGSALARRETHIRQRVLTFFA